MLDVHHTPRIAKFVRIYASVAVIVLNIIILLVLLNSLAAMAYRLAPIFLQSPIAAKYGEDTVRSVYPGWDDRAVRDLLWETWSRPYVFEPFTQFKERTFGGKYVNVSEHGFRLTKNQGPWPPAPGELNIFMFGGSTTFGYGVADGDTIASTLQELMNARGWPNIRVYNFGRGDYFSTQERLLFEQLLSSGFVPRIAIFLDGLNDFYHPDTPRYSEDFAALLENERRDGRKWMEFALVRAVNSVSARIENMRRTRAGYEAGNVVQSSASAEQAQKVVARYLANKRLIENSASVHHARPLFFWQPVPTYGYDDRYHPFKGVSYNRHELSRIGYPEMEKKRDELSARGNFFWIADMQEDLHESLYVDQVHYSPRFSRTIAERIADVLITREFVSHPAPAARQ